MIVHVQYWPQWGRPGEERSNRQVCFMSIVCSWISPFHNLCLLLSFLFPLAKCPSIWVLFNMSGALQYGFQCDPRRSVQSPKFSLSWLSAMSCLCPLVYWLRPFLSLCFDCDSLWFLINVCVVRSVHSICMAMSVCNRCVSLISSDAYVSQSIFKMISRSCTGVWFVYTVCTRRACFTCCPRW